MKETADLLLEHDTKNVLHITGLALPRNLGKAVCCEPEVFRSSHNVDRTISICAGYYIWRNKVVVAIDVVISVR